MSLRIPDCVSLYVHLPWCVKKCPYCDFNSHQLIGEIDEHEYISALLADFDYELGRFSGERIIGSIFIGGGTPSLFSPESISQLLDGLRGFVKFDENIEITLEANPGTADEARFIGYRQAGVNRLSIGVQSFNDQHLKRLGRIHDCEKAISAIEIAKTAQFINFNLDLMYCLPDQTIAQASEDILMAISFNPSHISAYHLTIEPNTLFAASPPILPDDETGWQIQQKVWARLKENNYQKYEISAYARDDKVSRHNINYWQFGDYFGIGAGAHGKISTTDGIYRTLKPKHPKQYTSVFGKTDVIETDYIRRIEDKELPLEYMMNKLRLEQDFTAANFEQSTGLEFSILNDALDQAMQLGLLEQTEADHRPTEKGRLFLDDLLQLFLSDDEEEQRQCCG